MEISVLPLHKHRKYLLECCQLVNEEWKRSETARLRSLESSCDNLPTSLVLIQNNKVIGHVKLSLIPSIKEACFVESVVIDKKLRGQGYGTILMKDAEDYCRNVLKLNTIYLSTRGQEKFYSKLGYEECQPISIYGNFIPKNDTVASKIVKETNNYVAIVPPVPPPLPSVTLTETVIKPIYMKKSL